VEQPPLPGYAKLIVDNFVWRNSRAAACSDSFKVKIKLSSRASIAI